MNFTDLGLAEPLLPEAVIALGAVPTAPYALTGTEEVYTAVAPFVAAHSAILLSHHGAVTLGDTPVYYGRFLTALINFLIIAATLFVIVRSFEHLRERAVRRGDVAEAEAAPEQVQIELLTEIRDALRERA